MFTLCLLVATASAPQAAPPVDPVERALSFLQHEVPKWAKEHRCYSCHNNGDAARALYTAIRLGRVIDRESLTDTTRWLTNPKGWDKNGGDGPFNDRKLASLQFAAALTAARAAGLAKDSRPLEEAAERIVALQEKDGSWQASTMESLPSPISHGPAIATHLARLTLQRANETRFKDAIARADGWFRKADVETILDAAGVLMALGSAKDEAAAAQKRKALDLIRKGEARKGGWGPLGNTPPEVFDTAVVLLGLAEVEQSKEIQAWRARGRAYLLLTQESDGGWPETTRPSGGTSYAQRLSTTGWATLALLGPTSSKASGGR